MFLGGTGHALLDRAGSVPPFRAADSEKQKLGALEQEHADCRSYLNRAADVVVALTPSVPPRPLWGE